MESASFEFEGPRGRLKAAAMAIGAAAQPGDVVALEGPLGAGKTVFAQSVARGVGVSKDVRISSPTFAIVHEYKGRIPLFHADLYRLSGPEAMDEIGLFTLGADGLVVVEWPDRAGEQLPRTALHVTIERIAPLRRRVRVHGDGPRAEALVEVVRALWKRQGADGER